ncbi:ig-like domain-containing protein [Caerostris extrusa]|uniref:Ig-like domain-containing protein n=1 Tax=Caerostris extrusa TaxID=172846 RepID=A0AAV4XH90_CAEEX|nr:ig-like domain-containing protein [Caerostris extrusa]
MNTLTVITKDGPLITGGESQYRVGEILNFNCSSTKSRPAPTLHWYLNEELVDDHSVIQYPTTLYPDGEEVSVLGLRLKVQPAHLDSNEEVRLKCTATLSRVINVRSDEDRRGQPQEFGAAGGRKLWEGFRTKSFKLKIKCLLHRADCSAVYDCCISLTE